MSKYEGLYKCFACDRDVMAPDRGPKELPDGKTAGGVQIGEARIRENHVAVDIQPFKAFDESSPMTEEIWGRIVEEMRNPRFAFERTFEGHRYTRRIR